MTKLNLKKIITLSASALMLVGTGAELVHSAKPVQASEIMSQYYDGVHLTSSDEVKQTMLNAGWSTEVPYNLNGKNSIKFHWYKTAQAKTIWNNIDIIPDIDWDVPEPDTGSGATTVLGYVTLNGTRYYITREEDGNGPLHYNDGGIGLHRAKDFETPTVMKAPSKIRTYLYGENGSDDNAYGVYPSNKVQYFTAIPNAKPVTLRIQNGKMQEFMPITTAGTIDEGATSGSMIKKSDYDKLVKTSQRVKYGYAYIQQKGNTVTTTNMKIARKIAKSQTKYFLKNRKLKNKAEKWIIGKMKWVAKNISEGYTRDM